MAHYTYDDFKARISISDVLEYAGYRHNRRDGLKYPSYVMMGSDGKRVRGDKFILTANGFCCFQPPEQKNYNIISFIKSFPEKFSEYTPGMDKDRLVNLVCNRILNNPIERNLSVSVGSDNKGSYSFDLDNYKTVIYEDSPKKFYFYFKNRGIDMRTQKAFSGHFFLTTKKTEGGNAFTNIAFPLTLPEAPLKGVVGLEERGRQYVEGTSVFKGMAAGSNASEGLWIARLENHSSNKEYSKPIGECKHVLWFESAYDAMAFYQLCLDNPKNRDDIGNAVFISTSGNPTNAQIDGMVKVTGNSRHILCFDRDDAGTKFYQAFIMRHPELDTVRMLPDYPYKDWNEQLLAKLKEKQNEDKDIGRSFRR